MSQRTQIFALTLGAFVVFTAVAAIIDPFDLFTPTEGDRPDSVPVSAGDDGESSAGAFRVDGVDEHGEYTLGPDGERVYRDADGRRYVIGPNGERVYIDAGGRRYVLGPDGERRYVDRQGSPVNGTDPADITEEGADTDGESDEEDAEEEGEPETGSLSGSVVDDRGNPYPQAAVVARVDGGKTFSVGTDDDGAYRFADLPALTPLTVVARDRDGNESKPAVTRLAAGNSAALPPLVLPRDSSIRGVVRNVEDGTPVSGASVQVLGADGDSRRLSAVASATTGPGGDFRFEKLAPRGYRVQVMRDGFTPRILNNVEPPEDLIVEMSPGAVISGTVRDTEGNPIADAHVSCDFHAEPAQDFRTQARTDQAGFYAVKCQPESQHNTITVIVPGFESGQRSLVKSGSEGVDFALAPTGNVVVKGRLLTTGGAPVTAASFHLRDAGGKFLAVVQNVGPDAQGRFRVESPVNAVTLIVRSNGRADVSAAYTPVAGGVVELGELYMEAGYAVFGIVHEVGDADSPVEGAEVRVGSNRATSDAEGRYRIEGISVGEFFLRALHDAYLGTAVKVTAEPGVHEIERNLELRNANFEARVLVKEEETEQPLQGVSITATAYGQSATTGADGLVHLTGLSSARVDVRVEKPGYATLEIAIDADVRTEVAEGPPQEVLLPKGDTISGVVTTSGEPAPGATEVEVWNETGRVVTVLTDSEGEYATEALPFGDYFVGVPSYLWQPRPVELAEDGAEFDIEIGPVSHLRGRVKRSDGQPHANAGVYVYNRENLYWTATIHTDPSGEYEITNLFPGEWVFCALKTQGDTAAQFAVPVTINQPGWNDVDVQLPQNTGVMTGRVTYPDGQPVKRARVAVTNLSANFERALLAAYVVTDDDGYYTAERLENGTQMQARVGGYNDDAETGTAFSETVAIPNSSAPVRADIIVPRDGATVRVTMKRADGGPILAGGPLSYLFDSQGRLSGLYFGSSGYSGTITLRDVPPGVYTLVVTNRGMKKATRPIQVGTQDIMSGLEILIEPEDRSSG